MGAALPEVECEAIHPTLHVPDVSAAAGWYARKLGFRLDFTAGDPPRMAGVGFGRVQLFLEQGPAHPGSVYFVVDDADALFERHRADGVEVLHAPRDQEWGLRDYSVRDPYGHVLGFGHRLHDAGPPIVVEREEVAARIEKRLAALLRDLAARKRMSVGSCLEEILLHTNDGVTPHTKRQVAFIQTLKQKHGIDYDTHGSYRFVER